MPGRTLRRFTIAVASLMLINLVMLAFLGKDADNNPFWIGLNLPGLPCGIGVALLTLGGTTTPAWLEYASLVVASIASSLIWAAIAAGIAQLATRNQSN